MWKPAYCFPVGQWMFYPELLIACNLHNGTRANFVLTGPNQWHVNCFNCPADYMFNELVEWFGKWITGKVA